MFVDHDQGRMRELYFTHFYMLGTWLLSNLHLCSVFGRTSQYIGPLLLDGSNFSVLL